MKNLKESIASGLQIVTYYFIILALPAISFAECPGAHMPYGYSLIGTHECLVRYHGYEKAKFFKPGTPDERNPFFDHYVETGRPGERGAMIRITSSFDPNHQNVVTFSSASATEPSFGLRFEIDATKFSIDHNGCNPQGAFDLMITDLNSSIEIGKESTPADDFVQNLGSELTVPLPQSIIKSQLDRNDPEGHLLTQVKLQCKIL